MLLKPITILQNGNVAAITCVRCKYRKSTNIIDGRGKRLQVHCCEGLKFLCGVCMFFSIGKLVSVCSLYISNLYLYLVCLCEIGI